MRISLANREKHKRQILIDNVRYLPSKKTFIITWHNKFRCFKCKDDAFGEPCYRLYYKTFVHDYVDFCLKCAPNKEDVVDTIINEFNVLYRWISV